MNPEERESLCLKCAADGVAGASDNPERKP